MQLIFNACQIVVDLEVSTNHCASPLSITLSRSHFSHTVLLFICRFVDRCFKLKPTNTDKHCLCFLAWCFGGQKYAYHIVTPLLKEIIKAVSHVVSNGHDLQSFVINCYVNTYLDLHF